jgi:uncharacterized membrane protein (UPF0182 family)
MDDTDFPPFDDLTEPEEPERTPPKRRPRRGLFLFLGILLVLFLSLGGIARFYTELLWFREIGFTSFFFTRIWIQFLTVVVAWLVAGSFAWINLRIASSTEPAYSLAGLRNRGIQEDLRIRYREFVHPYRKWIILAISIALGFLVAGGLQRIYPSVILYLNAQEFGVTEPVFGRDAGFYVFKLPVLEQVAGYAWTVFVLTTLLVAIVYYLNGSINLQAVVGERITKAAKTHLSVLLVGLALIQAYRYWLDRFQLLYSDRGVVSGASATDIKASLPAYNLLIVISLLVAVLLVVNIFRRGWALPVVSVGIWVVVQVLGAGVFPALYQRFAVQPNEFVREEEYIARNIEFTRYAYGLSGIELARYDPTLDLNFGTLVQTGADNSVRLWDPAVGRDVYNQLQSFRGYYLFTDVDVDRYRVGDDVRAVLVSTREIDLDRLPSQTWINRHLQFTHGYGVVMSNADAAAGDGRPEYLFSDMPVKVFPDLSSAGEEVTLTVPQIYYGDRPQASASYAIVNTTQPEFDFPKSGDLEATVSYRGSGGIPAGGILKKAAFAMRFGDVNPLISRQITSESKIIIRSDIKERVSAAFPLLVLDSDPYPVVADGRVVWIQDAYTVSNRFPYSQKLDAVRVDRGPEVITERLPKNSEFRLLPDANYVRNSVKVVVDAYDGSLKLYVVDSEDPIIRAYRQAFPALFTDASEAPESVRQHFRYPEELFRIQSNMFRIYHVTDPRTFYNQEDKWQVPERSVRNAQTQTKLPLEPYYTMLKDPRDGRDSFYIIQPFTPQGRPNLLGFILANSDPDRYGEIIAYSLPTNKLIDGPEQVMARINQDPPIAQELTLLDQRGSRVVFGNLLVLPLAGDLLYVQPVFLEPEDSRLPTLQRVIVVYKDRAVMRDCAAAALLDALDRPGQPATKCPQGAATAISSVSPGAATAPQPPTEATGRPSPEAPLSAAGLAEALDNAARAYDEAQSALRQGDLATYQRKVDEMNKWVEEARRLRSTQAQ